jgi:hypothetical protein
LLALKKAKALVRNFIWLGKQMAMQGQRFKWDTFILPLLKRGIKILDSQAQTSTFLLKRLIRGLDLGP